MECICSDFSYFVIANVSVKKNILIKLLSRIEGGCFSHSAKSFVNSERFRWNFCYFILFQSSARKRISNFLSNFILSNFILNLHFDGTFWKPVRDFSNRFFSTINYTIRTTTRIWTLLFSCFTFTDSRPTYKTFMCKKIQSYQ